MIYGRPHTLSSSTFTYSLRQTCVSRLILFLVSILIEKQRVSQIKSRVVGTIPYREPIFLFAPEKNIVPRSFDDSRPFSLHLYTYMYFHGYGICLCLHRRWKDDEMRGGGAECRMERERRRPENIRGQRKTCELGAVWRVAFPSRRFTHRVSRN